MATDPKQKKDLDSLKDHVAKWKGGKGVQMVELKGKTVEDLARMFESADLVVFSAYSDDVEGSGDTSADPPDSTTTKEPDEPKKVVIAMAPSKPGSE
jgi:hypothetical protein